MNDGGVPPRFLSLEFHVRFFPRLLRDRPGLRKREREGTSFTSTMEMTVVLVVCLVLSALGIPSAVTRGSIVGWVLTLLGVSGTTALIIVSIASQWGSKVTYDHFLTGIFFFFVCLGVFVGVPVGMDRHSLLLGFATSLAGLCAGYVMGIFAGLRAQHLGWMAGIINLLAGLASLLMACAMLIMLLLAAFS